MGPPGTRRIRNSPFDKDSMFLSDDSPLLDECKGNATENEHFGDTVPCEDNDIFDTQVMDFDHDTQVMDFDNDTPAMDFDSETQPVDLYEDTEILYLSGETQVMDDFDVDEFIDTQLLHLSDSETKCEDDEQGAETPQLSDKPEELLAENSDKTGAVENDIHARHQDDGGSKAETLPQDDSVLSSGLLREGFTAIRTASLRAAGLRARRKAPKDAYRPLSTELSGKSVDLQCSYHHGGISDAETVDLENDTETDDKKGLSNGCKSKVARSLAAELFREDIASDRQCNDRQIGEMRSSPQLAACDNEVAGLSYIDSQEPGELSQANALDVVDRFLKINVLESDHDVPKKNLLGACLDTTVKGPQSLAQQTRLRDALTGVSEFDWDDNREDEGGGEFFTKKKELLLGTKCGARRSRNPKDTAPDGGQSHGKLRNEKMLHNRTKALVHSDSKLAKGRRTSKHKGINDKCDNYPDLLEPVPSCDRELLASAPNAEPTGMLDVGIDTQMAAEAMDLLSNGIALATSDGGANDGDHQNVTRTTAVKNTPKQSSVKKQPFNSKSGTTKSKRTNRVTKKSGEKSKSSVACRTRSRCTVDEVNIDMLNPNVKRRRLPTKSISSRVHVSVAAKTSNLKVVDHVNGTEDESQHSRGERESLDVVPSDRDEPWCNSRGDVGSDNLNARRETLDQSTVVVSSNNDGASCRQKSLQSSSNQVNGSGENQSPLGASGHDVISQPVTRRTRSKRSVRQVEFPGEGKVLRSGVVLSSGHASQLSSEKNKTCSSPAQGAGLPREPEGSPVQVQNSFSPANSTPVNLRTPTSTVSPVCVGDGYPTSSCKKRSLSREFCRLSASELKDTSPSKELRQRRDFNSVRVLFSQHLDDDVIRKQKKILSRLGVPMASSISDSTHFVADEFVRTRNMLHAIACGKPVVTQLWLESCGQSNCFIDEKNYILRDAKKEKELDFSMPNSLARASHYPLLKGRKVLITPNVKPSKEVVSGLVKAVHGQAVERLCRSLSTNTKLPDNLLVLSCDEDLQECLPLLEKGVEIYSSELLLSGIITQKLEYERYRIFVDHVKRTRSTLWVKKNGANFLPVTLAK